MAREPVTPLGGEQRPARSEQPLPELRRPLDSATLLRGEKWVEIRHNGEVYRLQATRLGKLILTK